MREIKRPVRKIDGIGLVRGAPAYTEDLAPQSALIVKVLRSPHAFARIRNIDTTDAEKLPGVACVLTYKNVPQAIHTRAGQGFPEPSPYDKRVLDEYVRYAGDEAAAVAAIDEETAEEALKLIHIEYEKLEPVLDFERAVGHASVIHPEPDAHSTFEMGMDTKRNVAAAYAMHVGDMEETLKKCDAVVRARYYSQAQAHAAMEPHASAAWLDVNRRLTVISSTQTPFHVRRIIATVFGLPTGSIRVIKPRVGGGYGGKQALHGELLAAAVTLRTGRACQLIYTRKEVFESTYTRHATRIDMTLGATRDGTVKAVGMEVLSDTGAYAEHALTVMMVVGSKTLPLYNKAEAVAFSGTAVYTNHTPAGAFRGYGAVQGNFALESAMDELAAKLGIDPVELRGKNMIAEGETSPVFRIMGEGREGVETYIDTCKLEYCVRRGMELCGWREKYPRQIVSPTRVRGIGMAIAMQGSGIPDVDMASASIKLNDGGFFNLTVGATDLGTGSDTALAQIAAEALGVKTEDVAVYSSDTDLTPFDTGAYASSTTLVSGNAVKKAAETLKDMIIREGARRLGAAEADVRYDGTAISREDGQGSVTLKELSTTLYYSANQKQLAATESFVCEKSPPPYMAGFAEVEVDLETGRTELLNYTAVVDCGTVINPGLARIQVEGALAQGIGLAMFEDVKYSLEGRLLTNSLLRYGLPTRMDLPKFTVEFAESDEPAGPYGAKSVGEIGVDTPPAAILNAIHNATGVRMRGLPCTPEKLFRALQAAKKEQGGHT